MLTQLLAYLVKIIKLQQQFILILMTQLANIYLHSKTPRLESPTYRRFNQFKADDKLPLLQANIHKNQLNYQELLVAYQAKHGKPLKPVNHRQAFAFPRQTCPGCGAPSQYLYANGGGDKSSLLLCPDCQNKLELAKQRANFKVWRCNNRHCPHRKRELAKLNSSQYQEYLKRPSQFKLRYIYREYAFKIRQIAPQSRVDLSRIQASPQVLGLILSYYVNYGISAAKTAALMYDIHGIKISKQTILNYAQAVAANVRPFLDNYLYQLSSQLVGDETYLRVKGKWHYLFYFYDVNKKIILADYVTPKRTTESACIVIYQVLKKYQVIPANLRFTVDDNPIYRVARLYYAHQEGINFDLNIVKGLTNETEVAKEYRPAKQTIERLNRSLKANYRPMGGFKSASGSITYVTLYSLCHNFLRPHQSLGYHPPVEVPELTGLIRMPDKWLRLIKLAQEQLPTA